MAVTIDIIAIMQGLIILLAAAGVLGIFAMWSQLKSMNGKLQKHEEWQQSHKELDDVRFDQVKGRFDRLGQYLKEHTIGGKG